MNIKRNLDKHIFFSRMTYFIDSFIPNQISYENKNKEYIIKKALLSKFKTFYDLYAYEVELLKNKTTCKGRLSSADNRIKLITEGVTKYNDIWKQDKIHYIFIEKFNYWHNSHVDMLVARIHDIWNSKLYKTCYEKLEVELLLILQAFEMTIIDAEKTLGDLNGELDKFIEESGISYV